MVNLRDLDMIPKTKGDYMFLVKHMDHKIKEMDSAIPLNVANELKALGLTTSDFVIVYWRDGGEELLNIVAHWAVLINNCDFVVSSKDEYLKNKKKECMK